MSELKETVEAKKTVVKKTPLSELQSTSDYKWEKERIRDRQLVKGIFRFHEVPGGTLHFSYLKYKGDPIDKHSLTDGEVYTLPLGVARHLRTSGWYPVHRYIMDEKGHSLKAVGQKIKRYTFEPLDFIADEAMLKETSDKQIITVQGV
jgi:hypothetical protein